MSLVSLTFVPSDLPGGTSAKLRILLSAAAPAGGYPVPISGVPGVAPATITVPAGLGGPSTPYTPPNIPIPLRRDTVTAVVTGTADGSSRSTLLTVRAVPDVIAFGGSGTSGSGLLSPAVEAYPGRLQVLITDARLTQRVVNAGRGGRTSTDGLAELPAVLTPTSSVLILDLGANDYIKGIPLETTRSNLASMITLAQSRGMSVVLCGQSSMGETYTAMWAELATEYAVALVPDVAVGFVDGDRQADGHPTPSGHLKVAETIWAALAPILGA